MNVDFDALREELDARAAYAAELRRIHDSGGDDADAARDALALKHLEAQLTRVRAERERADAQYAERITTLEERIAALRARTEGAKPAASAPQTAKKRKKTPKRG